MESYIEKSAILNNTDHINIPSSKIDDEPPDTANLAMSGTAIFNNGKMVKDECRIR